MRKSVVVALVVLSVIIGAAGGVLYAATHAVIVPTEYSFQDVELPLNAESITVTRLAPEDAPFKLLVTFRTPGDKYLQMRFFQMAVQEVPAIPPVPPRPIDPVCTPGFVPTVQTPQGVGCVPQNHPLARKR